ncbi:MAG: protein kinase [Gemmataceae bacterium]|nr:protein kinase [Gemmataceae bacterium]
MAKSRTCPRCRASLRADAPEGLCPACLLRQALANDGTLASSPEAKREVSMIAFSCSHCGMKLQVKPEFAGRQSRCPTCKQSLVVPSAAATVAFVPPQQIDGEESSLARVGLGGGITLSPHDTSKPGTGGKPLVRDPLANRKNGKDRYVIEGEIARGGMGAVLRAVDCDIRREVAVKYMLDGTDPKKQARFIEEAQINGQLEHPNIVPVYDLGIDAQKRPFIMMKMVKGKSLKDVLDQLREQPKPLEKEWSLGRLLNALVNVCHALAFAHSRGVIHRDLKPANIMLGDFGEVYVMDWGLAKVLASRERERPEEHGGVTPAAHAPGSPRDSKVVTNRDGEADVTQEGSVLGTPVYMPPEQAAGQINAIDQRSDVYSLGAILYELLTLQPPVVKEGGQLGVLMQVVQGEITPPEKREPKRARAGKIPRELSAVAMKAMAKQPEDRYPNVEALRCDIERFQEGRAVSAKTDNVRELVWKLVKRNKGTSATAAAALFVLAGVTAGSFYLVNKARLDAVDHRATAERALAKFEAAEAARRDDARKAVPALVKAVKLMIAEGDVDAAMAQANVAVGADPDHPEARLLKGQLLLAYRQFAAAEEELTEYLRLRPGDTEARKLLELARTTRSEDVPALFRLAEELTRQKRYSLAERLTVAGKDLAKSRDELLTHYRMQVDAAWPTLKLGNKLTMDSRGNLQLDLGLQDTIRDLSPLRGIPLKSLGIGGLEVRDLSPLQGMPLDGISAHACKQLRDLKPLQGMKLTWLDLLGTPVEDLSPLQGMPLRHLNLKYCQQLRDLAPLKGMKLETLSLGGHATPHLDLAPLQGMPLRSLDVHQSSLQNLKVLEGMPLTKLDLWRVSVQDLAFLRGANLTELAFEPQAANKASIDLIRRMPNLKTINKMAAAEFWKKFEAGEFK